MPNRFQRELANRNGIIAGRRWSWQTSRGRRIPVELRTCGDANMFVTHNEILSPPAQRAFAVLDAAGAWRRLAREYLAAGEQDRARACKRAAYDYLSSAIRARREAEAFCVVEAAE
jgi:hypothetical protein